MKNIYQRAILYVVCVSSLSAYAQEDSLRTVLLQDLVITASRMEEDISKSPVSIEKVSHSTIQQSPAPSFFDGFENTRGVQMITPSMGFRVINTRGFTNTTNVRFVQMVNGMDNQAPHLGTPIANALAPNDLDIEHVEIIPGVASALYGMNAINGLANFLTKDPFVHTGFSIQQKIGVNRVGSSFGSKPYTETSFRWAKVFKSNLALKINGTFLSGTDWVANDETDLNPNANQSTGLTGADNPAIDPVNSYGNESSNRRTLSLNGKNYVVARTGYFEREVVDYSLRNLKADGSLTYAFKPDVTLSYSYRFAELDNVYQRSNRFRLDNYRLQQHGLAFQTKSLQARAYLNMENTGESYNARSMAENIDRAYKTDDTWYSNYASAYNNAVAGGVSVANAHHQAREISDEGRPLPGTPEFDELINELRDVNDWNYGAALRVRSSMFHAEAQLNLTESVLQNVGQKTGIELLAGLDHRTYIIVPDGNYFVNPEESGSNILYGRTGGFIQASKNLFRERLRLGATLRADKNEYYPLKWNPRFTAVYSPFNTHNIRFSYQNGYRFPSVFEAFSNVNSGGVKRVGGLPVMSSGIFENAYNRASIDAFQAAVNKDVNTNGLTRDQAIVSNQGLLKENEYSYVEPEHIRSFEVGYRGLLFADLQLDIDFYFNKYTNFIAQVEMNIPKTSDPDSIPFYLYDRRKQDRYRMWTNSSTSAYNYGSSLGLKYTLLKNFQVTGNVTYSALQHKSSNDGLEDGFNTPKWITNLGLGNEKIFKSLGFMINYRWQSTYYWQSFLVNGNVPAYQAIDAQVSYTWDKFHLKVGGTNIFNHYYNSYLGGPSVGGFYYTTVTLNL